MIEAWSKGPGTTKMVEDVFQRGRMEQLLGQSNNQMTPLRRFVNAIKSPVMDQVHQFPSIRHREVRPTKKELSTLGKAHTLFVPKFSDRSLPELDWIKGKAGSRPWWPTFSPQSHTDSMCDMYLFLTCASAGQYHKVGDAWQCQFFQRGLLVKHQSSEQWAFSLGTFGDSCLLTWPADVGRMAGFDEVWLPSSACELGDLKCHVVFDIREWQCKPLEWLSPVAAFIQGGRQEGAGARMGIAGIPSGAPKSLLQVAAEAAYWSWDMAMLKKVAKVAACGVDPTRAQSVSALTLRGSGLRPGVKQVAAPLTKSRKAGAFDVPEEAGAGEAYLCCGRMRSIRTLTRLLSAPTGSVRVLVFVQVRAELRPSPTFVQVRADVAPARCGAGYRH